MQRPLELCSWKDREALPPVGEEYQQRYKLVNDWLTKVISRVMLSRCMRICCELRVGYASKGPRVSNRKHTVRASVIRASAGEMDKLEPVSSWKQFGGWNRRYKVKSSSLGGTDTVFTVYTPPAAEKGPVPVVYFLSGLTCTDDNFITKAGAQAAASRLGLALVAPDTSPRGLGVEGEAEAWDFGVGAGFYLNATQPKWEAWRMYDWVVKELPALLQQHLSSSLDLTRAGIMGHSMGGHGAITIALKNPEKFRSISAFSPICNPTKVPWGIKAFTGYLGEDQSSWVEYDSTELMKAYSGPQLPLLVDQGTADSFLTNQLQPDVLAAAAAAKGYPMTLRMQDGYDHSYFFISTFVADHLEHHAKALLSESKI